MTNVEHIYSGFQWAEPLQGKELDIEWVDSDLQITGSVPLYQRQDSPCDLVCQYEKSPKQLEIGQQRTGTNSPDMRFANADTDEKLIAFVRRFGPVVARTCGILIDKEAGEPYLPTRLIAHQDMQELRNEQTIYCAALALVMQSDQASHNYVSVQQLMQAIGAKLTEELKQPKAKYDYALLRLMIKIIAETFAQPLDQPNLSSRSARYLLNVIAANIKEQFDKPNYVSAQQLMEIIVASIKKHLDQPIYDYFSAQKLIKIIAANIKEWPRQWEREKSLRGFEPAWKLTTESLKRIKSLSSAPPDQILPDELSGRIVICELLNSFPSIVFPNPPEMHSSIKFGIRPLLYSLLRRQFIDRRGFAVCANTGCRNFFNVERSGQNFCSSECSLRHRQRIYWQKKGKNLRKKRSTQPRKRK